jgi:hypothetical protein
MDGAGAKSSAKETTLNVNVNSEGCFNLEDSNWTEIDFDIMPRLVLMRAFNSEYNSTVLLLN